MKFSARLKPSRLLRAAVIISLSAGLSGVWFAELGQLFAASLTFAAIVSAAYHWLGAGQQVGHCIRAIHYDNGRWNLEFMDGGTERADIQGTRIVLPWLISIRFRTSERDLPCLVLADSTSQTEHRRLRIAVLQAPVPATFFTALTLEIREKSRMLAESWWNQNRVRWVRRLQWIIQRVV